MVVLLILLQSYDTLTVSAVKRTRYWHSHTDALKWFIFDHNQREDTLYILTMLIFLTTFQPRACALSRLTFIYLHYVKTYLRQRAQLYSSPNCCTVSLVQCYFRIGPFKIKKKGFSKANSNLYAYWTSVEMWGRSKFIFYCSTYSINVKASMLFQLKSIQI